ncbi:MAG: 5-oxoprolinase subunit PxpA [Chitinophagaceae bacterium]
MLKIDINCDMGEGIGNDEGLMPFISSANIACGLHAGDEQMMRQTIDLCIKYNVAPGSHPSFDDRKNFGRNEMHLSSDEIYDLVTKQIKTLKKIADEKDIRLHHVKPHGALYNMAARDAGIAEAIAKAVMNVDPSLILYGLAGSHSIAEAKKIGLKTANEVFADRTYQDDGSLTSRKLAGALIENTDIAIAQAISMIKDRRVHSLSGKKIVLDAETICIHGDGKHAVEFANAIYTQLKKEGIAINAI